MNAANEDLTGHMKFENIVKYRYASIVLQQKEEIEIHSIAWYEKLENIYYYPMQK
jgi:hypothetical protein